MGRAASSRPALARAGPGSRQTPGRVLRLVGGPYAGRVHVPDHFRLPEERLRELLAVPRPGNLVTVHAEGPLATFVPFHLEHHPDGRSVLLTHLVRTNPQLSTPTTGPAMVILDVVDAYVSPRWYATNDVQPNVPTWDYVTIHAWGTVRMDPSPERALAVARQLTSRVGDGDVLDAVGEEKLRTMSRAIRAVEVEVERIEGKAKMSQNRHPDDVRSLVAHFEEHGPAEVAAYLREVSLPHAVERFGTIERLARQHRVRAHRQGSAL